MHVYFMYGLWITYGICKANMYSNLKSIRQRPHHVENTSSRPITEVKQRWARLVLGWVTAWEHRVPLAMYFCLAFFLS